uniref:SAF domain-containing protein n=1 Tax=Syntrophomonas palmitatica TaxID=402877 RepID=UPI000A993127
LGETERIVLSAEKEQILKMRRSIIAIKDLKAGTRLSIDMLDAKRPGTGLPPEKIYDLVGKILIRDVEADTLLTEEDYK